MNSPALNRIIAHSLEHLPDSISARKSLLADMADVLNVKHPLRGRVVSLRLLLESAEQHQQELALEFSQSAK